MSGRDRIAGDLRRRSDLRYVYTNTCFANGPMERVFAPSNGLKGRVGIAQGYLGYSTSRCFPAVDA